MTRIYIAGPYSDDNVLGVLKNIGRGNYWASRLFKLGFAPFSPWHDADYVIREWSSKFTLDQFYQYSISWLSVSDGLFVVPNEEGLKNWEDSKGTLNEIQYAKNHNIPVFYDIIALYRYYSP